MTESHSERGQITLLGVQLRIAEDALRHIATLDDLVTHDEDGSVDVGRAARVAEGALRRIREYDS